MYVQYQNATSAPFNLSVASQIPAVFTLNGSGTGQAAAINNKDGSINGAASPAKVGDYVQLYITGAGQTNPAGSDGVINAAPLPVPVADGEGDHRRADRHCELRGRRSRVGRGRDPGERADSFGDHGGRRSAGGGTGRHLELAARRHARDRQLAARGRKGMPEASAPHLNLWKHRLGRVPDSVWEQTELETLVLADNDLSEVPEQIGRLQRLRMLDLGHNALTQVPEALGDIEGLTDFLYLHDNRLTTLPQSFERLTRLRYLNISENAFETLPECVCGMAGLIELRATDNGLTFLPEPVGRLSRLRELHLRNNKLTSLPDSIGGLRELRQIDLRGNPLTHLPAALAALPRLEKLDLRWVTTLVLPAWVADLEARGCAVYR